MKDLKNVLIDLDGTLINSKKGIILSLNYALLTAGYDLIVNEEMNWLIGPPIRESLKKIIGNNDKNKIEEIYLHYRNHYSEIGLYESNVFPEIEYTVNKLRQAKYKIYLATAKPTIYAKKILNHLKLEDYFHEIYGSELNGIRANKEELIKYILNIEKLVPSESIMIGDTEHDVFSSKKNNMKSIFVEYGYGENNENILYNADYKIKNFKELLTLLKID